MSAVVNVQAPVEQASSRMLCTLDGFRRGVRGIVPLSIGALAWGITFGVVAEKAGYSPFGALLMSLTVFSGSAQIVALEMAQNNGGTLAILGVTLLMSLRYILMGLTMSGWFRETPRWIFWPGIHYTNDQSWAMTLNDIRAGRRDIGYFFGINTTMLAIWVFGTVLGVTAGGWLTGHIGGLHFASTAALVGVLGEMQCRRRDVLPWIVAGTTAVLANQLIGGFWHMLIGVISGLAALLIQEDLLDRHH
jgi:4-azaleucine resistance transporter AzlC